MNEDDKKHNNDGCLIIGVVIFIIGSLVYFFANSSFESIAESGKSIMMLIGLIVSYFIIKAL